MSARESLDLGTMENFSNESLCPFTEAISGSPMFPVLLSLEAVFGVVSVVPNLVLAYVVLRTLVYPSNLRYLLAHMSLNIAWYSLGNAVKVLDTLSKSTCHLGMNAYECRSRELAITIPSGNIFYSLLGVCLERLYCSIRYRTYEKESERPWLACFFLSVIWIGSLAANLRNLPLIPKNRTVPICESILSIGPADALNSILTSMVTELIVFSVIFSVSCCDRRKLFHSGVNRAKFTLAERFQISQCVQVNKMLIPVVILHEVCFMPIMIVLLLIAFEIPMSVEVKWSLIHTAYLYRMLYGLVYPLVAFGRNARLRLHLIKSAPQFLVDLLHRKNSAAALPGNGPPYNLNTHFNTLDKFWATPTEKGAKIKAEGRRNL